MRIDVESPKIVMTDLWAKSRIDPAYWRDLMLAQHFADDLFRDGDAYPYDYLAPNRDMIFLSRHLPPTFASAMLRQHLIRTIAFRKMYQALGEPIA